MLSIVPASESLLEDFHSALDSVAQEKIYIEMIEAIAIEKAREFQSKLISNNWPAYYATDNGRVVGWIDITPAANPRLAHRGFLGMGLIASHRGQGLGTRLIDAALQHAKVIGLEKVELTVYAENTKAIKLYKKVGFEQEGFIKNYRKLEGRYFDCVCMAKFL